MNIWVYYVYCCGFTFVHFVFDGMVLVCHNLFLFKAFPVNHLDNNPNHMQFEFKWFSWFYVHRSVYIFVFLKIVTMVAIFEFEDTAETLADTNLIMQHHLFNSQMSPCLQNYLELFSQFLVYLCRPNSRDIYIRWRVVFLEKYFRYYYKFYFRK